MSGQVHPAERIRFGPFEANLQTGELLKHGLRLKLHDQPFHVLAMLVARPGELVSREEIQSALWPDGTFVDFENGLNSAVNRLRDALSDSADEPKFIETVPRRGYRFVATVQNHGNESHSARPSRVGPLSDVPRPQDPTEEPNPARLKAPVNRQWRRWLVLAVILVAAVVTVSRLKSMTRPVRRQAHIPNVQSVRWVYVSDYTENAILGYKVNPTNGVLEPTVKRASKTGEHPASIAVSVDRDYLYVANRGRADGQCGQGCNISGYAKDAVSGALVELGGSPYPAGKGPVAIVVHPTGKFVYVVNVISDDVQAYARNEDGQLEKLGPAVVVGKHPCNAVISPSGHFLYVSNQDDETVSAFEVGGDGKLRTVPGAPFETGLRPRSMAVDPAGKHLYVLNYGVNPLPSRSEACAGEYVGRPGRGCSISVFNIRPENGSLSPIAGSPFEFPGTNPLECVMDSAGKYLFVANVSSGDISVYAVDQKSGGLHPVAGSPFATGDRPVGIALDWSDEYLYVTSAGERAIDQFEVGENGWLTRINRPMPAGVGTLAIASERGTPKVQ
jgi:6-phosphogluconolactonase (cycloisomerase 2 family)/DNA-binding winged helix-turn-helix (wHTH) protein